MVGAFPDIPKLVLIGAPHSSNWDGVWGFAAKLALGLDIKILGKDSLFKVPVMGALLRRMGVIPVDRSAAHGVVEQSAAMIQRADNFWYGLAPEGTRKPVERWKTGLLEDRQGRRRAGAAGLLPLWPTSHRHRAGVRASATTWPPTSPASASGTAACPRASSTTFDSRSPCRTRSVTFNHLSEAISPRKIAATERACATLGGLFRVRLSPLSGLSRMARRSVKAPDD